MRALNPHSGRLNPGAAFLHAAGLAAAGSSVRSPSMRTWDRSPPTPQDLRAPSTPTPMSMGLNPLSPGEAPVAGCVRAGGGDRPGQLNAHVARTPIPPASTNASSVRPEKLFWGAKAPTLRRCARRGRQVV